MSLLCAMALLVVSVASPTTISSIGAADEIRICAIDHEHDSSCYADASCDTIDNGAGTWTYAGDEEQADNGTAYTPQAGDFYIEDDGYISDDGDLVPDTAEVTEAPTAEVEDPSVWDAGARSAVLTGDMAEDLVSVALTQLGASEIRANYITDEGGDRAYYSRYGHWFGSLYEEWSALFVEFCASYAGIGEDLLPRTAGVENLAELLEDRLLDADSTMPRRGDILFFTENLHADEAAQVQTGQPAHIGIVEACDGEYVYTIEGNCAGTVSRECYSLYDPHIVFYLRLQEETAEPDFSENAAGDGEAAGDADTDDYDVDETEYADDETEEDEAAEEQIDPEGLPVEKDVIEEAEESGAAADAESDVQSLEADADETVDKTSEEGKDPESKAASDAQDEEGSFDQDSIQESLPESAESRENEDSVAEKPEVFGPEYPAELLKKAEETESSAESVAEPVAEETESHAESVAEPVAEETESRAESVAEPVAEETESRAESVAEPVAEETESRAESVAESVAEETESRAESLAEPVLEDVELTSLTYEDGNLTVTVSETAPGVIPEGVSLRVIPLSDESEDGEDDEEAETPDEPVTSDESSAKVIGSIRYDIALIDEDGEEVEPNGEVRVAMDYKTPVKPEGVDEAIEEAAAELEELVREAESANEPAAIELDEETAAPEEPAAAVIPETDNAEATWASPENVESVGELRYGETDAVNGEETETEEDPQEAAESEAEEYTDPIEVFYSLYTLDVQVLHLEEKDGEKTEKIVDLNEEGKVVSQVVTEEKEIAYLEFTTDGFSEYSLQWNLSGQGVQTRIWYGYLNDNNEFVDLRTTSNRQKLGNELTPPAPQVDNDNPNRTIPADLTQYSYPEDFATKLDREYTFTGIYIRRGLRSKEEFTTSWDKVKYTQVEWKNPGFTVYYTEHNTAEDVREKSFECSNPWYGEYTIYYVYRQEPLQPLNVTDTVDHSSLGITMQMFDYDYSTGYGNQNDGGRHEYQRIGDNRYYLYSEYYTGAQYGNSADPTGIKQGLVQKTLNAQGYPVTSASDPRGSQTRNTSLEPLFNTNGRKVNHLFDLQTYNDTGYYNYDSGYNYAYLPPGATDFIVYDEVGTPVSNDTNSFAYKRGNFMPYNNIEPGRFARTNVLYDDEGNELEPGDDMYDAPLYLAVPDESYGGDRDNEYMNYFFGMTMDLDFYQPEDGRVSWKNNAPNDMTFRFNGDDDMWVFIDGVLILDIGGVHDARGGEINFATGQVIHYRQGKVPMQVTYIKDLFRDAGVLPNGDPWSEERAADFFDGNTFKDETIHNLKMFYMERGAGASNLHLDFNLASVPADEFTVEKKLGGTEQGAYTDQSFSFKAYAQHETSRDDDSDMATYDDSYVVLTSADLKSESNTDGIEVKDAATGEAIPLGADGVFSLRPGQKAVFSGRWLKSNRKYYIEELGIDSTKFSEVEVHVTERGTTGSTSTQLGDASGGEGTRQVTQNVSSPAHKIGDAPATAFINHPTGSNLRKVRIRKVLNGTRPQGADEDPSFKLRIEAKDQGGDFVSYAGGHYYLLNSADQYCFIDADGNLQTQTDKILYGRYEDADTYVPAVTPDTGVIEIRAGYTILLEGFLEDAEFRVTEIDLNPTGEDGGGAGEDQTGEAGAAPSGEAGNNPSGADGEVTEIYAPPVLTGEHAAEFATSPVTNGGQASWKFETAPAEDGTYSEPLVTVTNSYKTVDIPLRLLKVDDKDDSLHLQGAVVDVYTAVAISDPDGTSAVTYVKSSETPILTLTSDANGFFKDASGQEAFKVTPGQAYILKEMTAPENYALSGTEMILLVSESGEVTASPATSVQVVTSEDEEFTYEVHIKNTKLYTLPATGGRGTYLFTIIGAAVLMAMLLMMLKDREQENDKP